MSIFPSVPTITEEEIQEIEGTEQQNNIGRSFVFNFETGQFLVENGQIQETTELQALEQWIQLCLQTYMDKFNVYKDTGFGCNIEDMVGVKLDAFYESELTREIEEGLLKNNQIESVNNISITQENISIIIDIDVTLTNGSFLQSGVKI